MENDSTYAPSFKKEFLQNFVQLSLVQYWKKWQKGTHLWKSNQQCETHIHPVRTSHRIKTGLCHNTMFCDLETVWQEDTGFEHRACFFARQFQKTKCDLSDKFRCLVDGVESILSSGAPDIGDFSQI